MSRQWGKRNGYINRVRITKSDYAYKKNPEPIKREKSAKKNWFLMIGIIVADILLTTAVDILMFGTGQFEGVVGATEGGTYIAMQVLNSVIDMTIDISANFASEMAMGRLSKSRIMLNILPVFGTEMLGKTFTLARELKSVKLFVKELENTTVKTVGKRWNSLYNLPDKVIVEEKIPQDIIEFISRNPRKFMNASEKMEEQMVKAYKNHAQLDKLGLKRIKAMKKVFQNKKYKYIKQSLWKKYGDESLFNEDRFLGVFYGAKETGSHWRNVAQQIGDKMDYEQSRIFYNRGENIAKAIDQASMKLKGSWLKPSGAMKDMKGSSDWVFNKIKQFFKREQPKATNVKGAIRNQAGSKLEFVSAKELQKGSGVMKELSKFNQGLHNTLAWIHSWTKLLRYVDPLYLMQKGARSISKGLGTIADRIEMNELTKLANSERIKYNEWVGLKDTFTSEDTFKKYWYLNKLKKNRIDSQKNWTKADFRANFVKESEQRLAKEMEIRGIDQEMIDRVLQGQRSELNNQFMKQAYGGREGFSKFRNKWNHTTRILNRASSLDFNGVKAEINLWKNEKKATEIIDNSEHMLNSQWIQSYDMLIDMTQGKVQKFPIRINFKPLETNNKESVITDDIDFNILKEFITADSVGRYYLQNFAYGYDYFNNAFAKLGGAIKSMPLEFQKTLYDMWNVKRDIGGAKRSVLRLKRMNGELFQQELKRSALVGTRNLTSKTGVGFAVNPFITTAVGRHSVDSAGKSLSSRRLNVARRRIGRRIKGRK